MSTTIVFIGAGFSNTSLLIALVEKIKADPQFKRPDNTELKILLIDQNGDFGTGVAYGRNAANVFLLNDNVKTTNVFGFRHWLIDQKDVWLSALRMDEDIRVRNWLTRHLTLIEQDDLDDLFLPRSIFGLFMKITLQKALDSAARVAIEVDLIQDTVTAVDWAREKDSYQIWTASGQGPFQAKIVVLGIGLPPQNKPDETLVSCRYIQNIYRRSFPDVEEEIRRSLAQSDEKRLVVLGSSATAFELLYCLFNEPSLSENLKEVLVVSTSGTFPCARRSDEICTHEFTNTRRLLVVDRVGADDLYKALKTDILLAEKQGWTIHDMMELIRSYFPKVFERLSLAEKARFVQQDGARFMDITRRTAIDYGDTVNAALESGVLKLVKGRVLQVEIGNPELLVTVELEGEKRMLSADAVINCMSAPNIDRSDSTLIMSLINNNLIKINRLEKGIDVNVMFESSPGFFVFGPLLAGLSNTRYHIWQLESIPQINRYSGDIANNILHRLGWISA